MKNLVIAIAVSATALLVGSAANAGDKAAFNSWWAFGGGMGNGFFALAGATVLNTYLYFDRSVECHGRGT